MSDALVWPLGHRDAYDAATSISEPLVGSPKAHRLFRRQLAGRLVGAADKADMLRRLAEHNVAFRKLLPSGPS